MENADDDVIRIKIPQLKGITTSRLRENPWIMSTFALIVLAIVLLFNGSGEITGNVISGEQAGQKVLDLAKAGDPGARLVDVNLINGLYEVIIFLSGEEVPVYLTADGENLVSGLVPIDLLLGEIENSEIEDFAAEEEISESTFSDTGDEICKDTEGKPYVILVSTTWCPHCKWIKDTFESLADEDFADQINLQHWEVDTGDSTLTPEVESEVPNNIMSMYQKYNPAGSIPTFIFGCKYTRIGNGYETQQDLNAELEDFKLIINKLLE